MSERSADRVGESRWTPGPVSRTPHHATSHDPIKAPIPPQRKAQPENLQPVGQIQDGNRTGVKLAAVRVGGTLFVTPQALADFLAALNGPPAPEVPQRSPNARRKAADEAVRRLNEMGA